MCFPWCYFACFLLLLGFGVELTNSQNYRVVRGKLLPYKTIIVDPSGKGNFQTIQSAIDSIPSNNRYWVAINVKAGTYREKLVIPYDKPYIVLQGEGKKSTFVEWDDHETIAQSPTFSTMADNIVVKFISFINSYNRIAKGNPVRAAVAALVSGDKCYFLSVGFFGFQDTLWDVQGRHYYKLCTIYGAVDFIFGAAQSLYEKCTIYVIAGRLGPGIYGFITAQGRSSPRESNGFVFRNCDIRGNGITYLGRPWREYARVIFFQTHMSNIIQPYGWDPWRFNKTKNRITFAEYNNSGPGSNLHHRVQWINKLDIATVKWMTSFRFIDSDGWLKISLRINA